jgi:hypothetical protein
MGERASRDAADPCDFEGRKKDIPAPSFDCVGPELPVSGRGDHDNLHRLACFFGHCDDVFPSTINKLCVRKDQVRWFGPQEKKHCFSTGMCAADGNRVAP